MQGQSQFPEQGNRNSAESGTVADAVQGNWVDRIAPPFTRPYLRLSRADRPIGTWLLLLPCWWGIMLAAASGVPRWVDLWLIIGCALGAFLMRGAGCTWNDITDRHIDAQVARTRSRPIPSGQVSVFQAMLWLIAQTAISALILFSFNLPAILVGVASLIPVAVYPFAKRFTWWPQAFLGIAFNWGALVGWTAHTGALGFPAVLLWLSGLVWTLFYDTIYAHQDKADDVLIGVKSTARLFADKTKLWLSGFLVLSTALLVLAILTALLPHAGRATLIIALVAPVVFAAHLLWQLFVLNIDDTDVCLRLFRSNRDAGLLVALFLAVAAIV